MKKPSKKTIIIVIILLFVGVFVWQRFAGKSDKDVADVYRVSRGTVSEMVSDSGDVRPEKYANLSFEVPTVITSVDVAVGDTVTEGQKLITIDRNQLGAQIHAARVEVEQAVAREQLARRHWDALKPEEKEQYRKDVERARAMLRATQSQWSKTVLRAPMDGIVTQQEARVGEIAQGVVVRVIDPRDLHIESLMSESDVVRMHVGQEAQITFDAFDNETFIAHITQIDPEAVTLQDVTYYKVTLVMDKNDDRVRSGMGVDVDIVVAQKEHVLHVPLRFIRTDDDGAFVYVQSGEGYTKKYITTGLEGDAGNVEVVDGLTEGEEIFAIYEQENE
ncbi:MAG: hypothetical protein CR972_04390 [Candidatus Moraniibacteriota bacterium]|nr:MAG: hypothetical protein CR972_04390 [Candidatus Moranbacteria bacterium]